MSSPSSLPTLLVIAKEPRPGRVKTRLTPPFTPGEAAELAEAALADTLRAVARTPASRRLLVLDGTPGAWLPPGFDVVPQCAGGLDERLADAFARCDGPALLIGMDTPQVTPELLTVDFADCDACFGPAEDGGFWALGLARPDSALLRGVPMSTAETGAVQRGRLVTAGLRVRDLPRLRDVDTAADAHAVAALAPHGHFAARLARWTAETGTSAGRAEGPYARQVTGGDPRPVAENGSRQGTERGSRPGTGRGSRESAGGGSRPGAERGSRPGAEDGSRPGTGRGSRESAGGGSRLGTERGSRQGAEDGSRPGTGRGSRESAGGGSRLGTERGSRQGAEDGSRPGTGRGSRESAGGGSRLGTERGSRQGTEHGSRQGTERGSLPGTERGSLPGTEDGSRSGTGRGSRESAGGGSRSGTGQNTRQADGSPPVTGPVSCLGVVR